MIGFFFSIDFHYLNFKLLKPWDKKVQKKKKSTYIQERVF